MPSHSPPPYQGQSPSSPSQSRGPGSRCYSLRWPRRSRQYRGWLGGYGYICLLRLFGRVFRRPRMLVLAGRRFGGVVCFCRRRRARAWTVPSAAVPNWRANTPVGEFRGELRVGVCLDCLLGFISDVKGQVLVIPRRCHRCSAAPRTTVDLCIPYRQNRGGGFGQTRSASHRPQEH